MSTARRPRRLYLVLVAVAALALLASDVPTGGHRARAATAEGTIGAQAGFTASWQMLWMSDQELAWELDGIAASGVRWLRVDFNWPAIQPDPWRFNWGPTDRLVWAARARGLQVVAMPAYTPGWARPWGTDDKHPPSDPGAFANFVAAAAQRYRPAGVRHWEIWNEPNQWYWWKPYPNAWAYAALLQRAYPAIKAQDPYATVIAGGLAPAPDAADGSEVNAETFVRQLYQAGARRSFDALAMHPYNYPVEPMYPHPMNAFASTTPAVRRVMEEHGDGWKKLWLTEYGAPTSGNRAVSEDQQAEFLMKAYDQVVQWPWAGPLFYYVYRNHGWDPNNAGDNFGLLRRDWSWKTGMSAFVEEMAKPLPSRTRLAPGQGLAPGGSLVSADLRYSLVMQHDGNLVLFNAAGAAMWWTGTYGQPGAHAVMQSDGNLVVFTAQGSPVWWTGTYGHPGASMVVQNDGNVVVYTASGAPVWWTGTWER